MTNEQWKDKGICYECRRKSYCNKSCKAHDEAIKRRLSELVTERVFGKLKEQKEPTPRDNSYDGWCGY